MPQAPDHLRDKFPSDSEALELLHSRGYKVSRGGVIFHPDARPAGNEEWTAIEYLILEWDYGYSRVPLNG